MALEGASIVVVKRNGNEGNIFTISTDTVSIGTDIRCDIRIHKPGVEAFHCCITREGREVILKNKSTLHPTLINNAEFDRHPLSDDDIINVCGSTFKWKMPKAVPNRRWTTFVADNKKKSETLQKSRTSCALPSTSTHDDDLADASESSSKQVAVIKPLVRPGIADGRKRDLAERQNYNSRMLTEPTISVNSSSISAERRPISLESTTENGQITSPDRPTVAVEGVSTFRRIQYPRPDPNRRRVRNYIAMSIGPMIRRQLLATSGSDSSDSSVHSGRIRTRTAPPPVTSQSRPAINTNNSFTAVDSRRRTVTPRSESHRNIASDSTSVANNSVRRSRLSAQLRTPNISITNVPDINLLSPQPSTSGQVAKSRVSTAAASSKSSSSKKITLSSRKSARFSKSAKKSPAKSIKSETKTPRSKVVSTTKTRKSKSSTSISVKKIKGNILRKSKTPPSNNKKPRNSKSPVSVKKVKVGSKRKLYNEDVIANKRRKIETPLLDKKKKAALMVLASPSPMLQSKTPKKDVSVNLKTPFKTPINTPKPSTQAQRSAKSIKTPANLRGANSASVKKIKTPIMLRTPKVISATKTPNLTPASVKLVKGKTPEKRIKSERKSIKSELNCSSNDQVDVVETHLSSSSSIKKRQSTRHSITKSGQPDGKMLKKTKSPRSKLNLSANLIATDNMENGVKTPDGHNSDDESIKTTPLHRSEKSSEEASETGMVHDFNMKGGKPDKTMSEPRVRVTRMSPIGTAVTNLKRNLEKRLSLNLKRVDNATSRSRKSAGASIHEHPVNELKGSKSEPRVPKRRQVVILSRKTIGGKVSPKRGKVVTPKTNVKLVSEVVKKQHSTAKKPVSRKSVSAALGMSSKMIKGLFKNSPKSDESANLTGLENETEYDARRSMKLEFSPTLFEQSLSMNVSNVSDKKSTRQSQSPKRLSRLVKNTMSPLKSASKLKSTRKSCPAPDLTENDFTDVTSTQRSLRTSKSLAYVKHNISSPNVHNNRRSRSANMLDTSADLFEQSIITTDVHNVSLTLVKNKMDDSKTYSRSLKQLTAGKRSSRSYKSPKNDLTNVAGVKKRLRTPKPLRSPKNDLTNVAGVKRLLRTPKYLRSPKNDLTNVAGVKRLLRTPKPSRSPKNDLTNVAGVKRLLGSPKSSGSPKNDLTNVAGVKRLLGSPKRLRSPKNDLTNVAGVKRLLGSPKPSGSPKNDLTNVAGVKRLLGSPKRLRSPNNDLTNVTGVRWLLRSPKNKISPKNDLTNVSGVKKLLKTPRPYPKSPKNDLTQISGIKKLYASKRPYETSPNNDLSLHVDNIENLFDENNAAGANNSSEIVNVDVEDDLDVQFDSLINKPIIKRKYGAKSTTPKRMSDVLVQQFSPSRKSYGANVNEAKINVTQSLEETSSVLKKVSAKSTAVSPGEKESRDQRSARKAIKTETPARSSSKRNRNVTPALENGDSTNKKQTRVSQRKEAIIKTANISTLETDEIPEIVPIVKRPLRRNRRLLSETNGDDWPERLESPVTIPTLVNDKITHPALAVNPDKVSHNKRVRPRLVKKEVKAVKKVKTQAKKIKQEESEMNHEEDAEATPAKRTRRNKRVPSVTDDNAGISKDENDKNATNLHSVVKSPVLVSTENIKLRATRARRKVKDVADVKSDAVSDPAKEMSPVAKKRGGNRRKKLESDEQDNVEIVQKAPTRSRTTRNAATAQITEVDEPEVSKPNRGNARKKAQSDEQEKAPFVKKASTRARTTRQATDGNKSEEEPTKSPPKKKTRSVKKIADSGSPKTNIKIVSPVRTRSRRKVT